MSTSSAVLPHPCPLWQGAPGQAVAVEGCPSPGSSLRLGWGYVLSCRHQVWWDMGSCDSDHPGQGSSGGQSLMRALQDTASLSSWKGSVLFQAFILDK